MIDPIAQKAADAFTHDKSTAELAGKLAPEFADAFGNLWVHGDPPPITADEHALFLSLSVHALAETVGRQAEKIRELEGRLATVEGA